jgi:hypothetical protein
MEIGSSDLPLPFQNREHLSLKQVYPEPKHSSLTGLRMQ